MNKNAKPSTKLALSRRTIKQLQDAHLHGVAGGVTNDGNGETEERTRPGNKGSGDIKCAGL